jgi:1,4-dihydroxy-2-naphthoyl-CoA hydrolase
LAEPLDAVPFAVSLGVELVAAEVDEVRGRLAWAPERCTAGGIMHGGALMSLADTLGGVCAFLNLPPGSTTATIESKTNFFRAVREGFVTGTSRPLHVGRSFIVVQTELVDDGGRNVALMIQTQAVLTPKEGG